MASKAIILAAGMGTRLRPLTDDRPKCLVPLKGVPLLEYQLSALRAAGIDRIVLVTGYESQALRPYGLKCYENPRFDSTNMVHSFFCAEREFDDDIVVCYGDIVIEPSIVQRLVAATEPFAVIVDRGWQKLWEKRMEDPLADAESLRVDSADFIQSIGQKPQSIEEIQGQYIGLFKISRSCMETVRAFYHGLDRSADYDGKNFDNMYMTSFIQRLIDSRLPVKALFVEHGWLEVDSVADLETYQSMTPGDPLFNFEACHTIPVAKP